MSKAAASALSLLRQAIITLAPLFARSRAVDLPMPVLDPVQENHKQQNTDDKELNSMTPNHRLMLPASTV